MELFFLLWNNEPIKREGETAGMKVTGIIAECNPLHEGHRYLIREAREQTGADYVVIAMSGDYVQRGAPSILSREERAAGLLSDGADLVLQLPLYVSCSGADYFARGAVALLSRLGVVTDLVFGSESGDLKMLEEAARMLGEEDDAYRASLREALRSGMTFAEARSSASGRLLPDTPNDLLGTEYLIALSASRSRIRPHAVLRTPCRSASDIREELLRTRQNTDPFLCRDDLSDLLLHSLYSADSADELCRFLDVSYDLAGRILHELPFFTGFSSFCSAVKTRNYTYTRVSRALLHILLGMTSETMEHFDLAYGLCGWIRPIGFKKTAGPLLHAVTSGCSVPFLDKLSRAGQQLPADLYAILREELRAEFLYDLMAAKRTGRSWEGVPSAFSKPLILS